MMVLSLEVGLTFKKIDDTIIQKKNKTFLLFFFQFSSFPKNNFKLILGKKRVDIYYELLVAIILVPAIMLLGKIAFMKFGNTKKHFSQGVKSSTI